MKLLRLTDVMDRVGLKKSKIYELIKGGNFPEQIKICGASTWLDTEIDKWIMEQVSAARG